MLRFETQLEMETCSIPKRKTTFQNDKHTKLNTKNYKAKRKSLCPYGSTQGNVRKSDYKRIHSQMMTIFILQKSKSLVDYVTGTINTPKWERKKCSLLDHIILPPKFQFVEK